MEGVGLLFHHSKVCVMALFVFVLFVAYLFINAMIHQNSTRAIFLPCLSVVLVILQQVFKNR